ncbi:hypothetical protein J6590_046822 [Homalodisca vitripennis]|nr:hypothetical protein J6590_046822 [Homalodisca vitripennis]
MPECKDKFETVVSASRPKNKDVLNSTTIEKLVVTKLVVTVWRKQEGSVAVDSEQLETQTLPVGFLFQCIMEPDVDEMLCAKVMDGDFLMDDKSIRCHVNRV